MIELLSSSLQKLLSMQPVFSCLRRGLTRMRAQSCFMYRMRHLYTMNSV